jgi:hypothetical protein
MFQPQDPEAKYPQTSLYETLKRRHYIVEGVEAVRKACIVQPKPFVQKNGVEPLPDGVTEGAVVWRDGKKVVLNAKGQVIG